MSLLLLLQGDGGGPEPLPTATVVRELMPLGVHITGDTPNGHEFRWGRDEPDPTNVPSGMRWSDTMPGGFDRASCVLPRLPGVDYSDLQRLSTLAFRDVGGGVLGEYRLERAPRSSGEQMSVAPDAVGWQAHLDDDRTATALIIDRDLAKWTGPSAQRRLALIDAALPHQQDAGAGWDTATDGAALTMSVQGTWARPTIPRCEGWYDAGASRIGHIDFAWSGWADTAFQLTAIVTADTGSVVTYESSGDLYSAASGSVAFAPSARYRYCQLIWAYASSGGGADGTTYAVKLTGLAVHGDHGLVRVGGGYLASDIVAYVLSRFAPLLRFSIGQSGTIAPTSFAIPQAAWGDQTTAAAIVGDVSRYELPDWAVWENRTFYLHPRGARGRRWRARVGPSGLEETGPQVDRLWGGVAVSYNDPDGTTRTVGPPGSGCDTEDVRLLDRDPANPVNQLNMRKWALLQMGQMSTPAGATQVGAIFLEQSKLFDTSGSAKFTGYVQDENGVLWPYHQVRAGDQVSFVDAADTSWRRIVQAEKDADARTCTVSLDSPPEGLDALLAQLGVSLSPYGLS